MALRLQRDGRRRTLGRKRGGWVVLGLVVVGLLLIAFGGDSLPAVIGGIAAILAAAIVAMRG